MQCFCEIRHIHLQQEATPDYDIVAGLCFAMARNFKGSIGRGKAFSKSISFQGGVAANKGMVRAFESVLGIEPGELIIPRYFTEMALKEPDSTRDTFLIENINQKNEGEIFSNFRKTLRHSIEKAKDYKLMIERCENKKELEDFYCLYLKNTRRHRNIPYPFSLFEYFLNSPSAEIVLAKNNKKIMAGSIFLSYEKYIHYFINASDIKYREKRGSYLILWEKIRECAGKEYKNFDLGGTRRGSSLEIFKRGFEKLCLNEFLL